jgi:hypothetical protein
MTVRVNLLVVLMVLTAASAYSSGLSGHWKSYGLCTALNEGQPREAGSWQGMLRLQTSLGLSSRIRLESALDVLPTVRDSRLWEPSERTLFRLSDPDPYLYPEDPDDVESFAVLTNLDRAIVGLRLSFADLIAGRQAISWGTAHYVSPTDFLAPYPFYQLETEDRLGVDALRVRIPLGLLSEVDLGVVSGYHARPDSSAAYARLHTYVYRSDIDLMAGVRRRDIVLGCNASRAVGGASVWIDGACTFLGSASEQTGETMLRASLGVDYRLAADLYGQLEYHYSSRGSSELGGASGIYLNGNHYLIPGLSWQASPLVTVAPSAFVNLKEPSAYLMTALDYNIAQNVFLGLGSQLSFGRDSGDLGAYPDVFYASGSYYF